MGYEEPVDRHAVEELVDVTCKGPKDGENAPPPRPGARAPGPEPKPPGPGGDQPRGHGGKAPPQPPDGKGSKLRRGPTACAATDQRSSALSKTHATQRGKRKKEKSNLNAMAPPGRVGREGGEGGKAQRQLRSPYLRPGRGEGGREEGAEG